MKSEFRAAAAPGGVGVLPLAELPALTGLEQLERIVDGRFPAPPMAAHLDFRLVEVAEGRARFEGTPRADFYNPLGTIHGGWAATLLDSALACAVHTTLAAGEAYTTLEHFPFRSKRSERRGIAQAIESGAISDRSGEAT